MKSVQARVMSLGASTQAEALASKLNDLTLGVTLDDGIKPRVIFASPLELTRQQEERLMLHARQRLQDLSTELGRDEFASGEGEVQWSKVQDKEKFSRKWMAKHYFAHLMYGGHVEYRAQQPDTIYASSNLHIPIGKRIVMQQSAKAADVLTGGEPWWGCWDVGDNDAEKAKQIFRYLQHEFHGTGNMTADVNAAMKLAFIQGQQVCKTTAARDVDYYETVSLVAVDSNGEGILAQDNDYIYEHDEFVQAQGIDGKTAEVLKRDGVTSKPPTDGFGEIYFRLKKIPKRLDRGARCRLSNIHYLDFLCPLTSPTIEEADFVAHLYDKTVIELAHQYIGEQLDKLSAEEQISKLKDVTRLVQAALLNSNRSSHGDNTSRVRGDHGEQSQSTGVDRVEQRIELAEVWLRFDANEDGKLENMVLLMDRSGNIPIYYDYAANMTPDGCRPFRALVINKVADRWHGQGTMEVYERLQESADLLLNRWNFSQSKAGRLDITRPHLTVEGQEDPDFKLNYGRTVTPTNDQVRAEDIIQSVYLRDIKGNDLHALLQLVLQISMNMSGVANANDNRMAGLDTAQLATGIVHLEKSGDQLFNALVNELVPGLRDVVKAMAKLVLAFVDQDKAFTFFEGEQNIVSSLSLETVRQIEIDIRIDLSKLKGQQDLERYSQAFRILADFYQLPFLVQERVQGVVIEILKAMQIKRAEQYVMPIDLSAPPIVPQSQGSSSQI